MIAVSRFTFSILIGGFIAIAMSESPAFAQESARTQGNMRRIPVSGYFQGQDNSSRVMKEEPSEQPGRVTSVEIRNAEGEIVDGELGENEYFLGAAPMPLRVGQQVPSKYASSPEMAFDSYPSDFYPSDSYAGDSYPSDSYAGDSYAGDSYAGDSYAGDSYAGDGSEFSEFVYDDGDHPHDSIMVEGEYFESPNRRLYRQHPHYDPRVERLAHLLAHPFDGFWARAEYMHLLLDGQGVVPLVTTSDAETLRENAGVLGLPTTRTLYGGNDLGDDERAGGRFEIGRYLDGSGLGVSASFLFAEDVNDRFSANSVGFGILARPFVDVSPGGLGNDAELVSFLGEITGNIDVRSSTSFYTGDVLLRALLICNAERQLEGFVGYTYMSLDDDLSIRDFKRVVGGGSGLAIGTTLDETDRFAADNNFNGAAFGVRGQTNFGRWSFATTMKLGLGVTSSTVTTSGVTTRSVPVAGGTDTATRNTGLLVQDTNSGVRDYDEFAVSPEVRLVLTRQLSRDWSVSVGYQLMYLSRVMRAGEQIDPLLNLTGLDAGGLQGFRAPGPGAFYNDLTAEAISIGLLGEF